VVVIDLSIAIKGMGCKLVVEGDSKYKKWKLKKGLGLNVVPCKTL
jgi:hypothetical protein